MNKRFVDRARALRTHAVCVMFDRCVASAQHQQHLNIRAKRSGTRKFLPGREATPARQRRAAAADPVAHRLLAPEAARRGGLFAKEYGMNYKFAAATLVRAGALGAAGWSHNNQEGPASNASQTPPYSAATAAQPAGTAPAAGMTSGAAGANSMGAMSSAGAPTASFSDLAGSKGYITQQDAQRDSWLGAHFTACDADHDGKLTQQEYTQCTQTHGGTNMPEGVPSSPSSTH